MNKRASTLAAVGLGILFGVFAQFDLRAQQLDPRTSGSTYVIAFPDTTTNTYDTRFSKRLNDTFALFMYSAVDNVVNITSPLGYQRMVNLKKGKFEIVYLNAYENRAPSLVAFEIGVEASTTFRVETEHPILLYCYLTTKFGTEAFTPLPVESWGRDYFAASFPDEVAADVTPGGETTYRSKNIMASSELLITAAFDNTIVQIYPSSRTELLGKPRLIVTLKANQCYLLETLVDTLTAHQGNTQSEMAGTRIVASKPVSVISGNTRAQLNPYEQGGLARNSFKNLCIEALAPIEQHGREFVYLPTWDARRITGQSGEEVSKKRAGEWVRIYGENSTATTIAHDSGGGTVELARVYQNRIWIPRARVYRTSNPSQAFHGCIATVIFKGTTGSVGFLGASYEAYAPYMVELVPREQWTSFAPYYAPTYPPQMEHFVNIVADTASARRIYNELGAPVAFNRGVIPGTDLVWGSMAVAPGVDHYFIGRDGARFFAFAYGLGKGYELYRPGRAGKKDGPPENAGGGSDDGNHLLHPSEYEEEIAQSYGYPLAPGRVVLASDDSLVIETTVDCESVHFKVRTVNSNPLGLRTVYLDSVSTRSDLTAASLNWRMELIAATQAEFDVVLHSGAAADSGSVIIQDRSGRIHAVPFHLKSGHVSFNEGRRVEFPETRATETADTVVVVTNISSRQLPVTNIALGGTLNGFRITGITPALPVTLQPGEPIRVALEFVPPAANQTFRDTLSATSDCGNIRLALVAESVLPCLSLSDLNFGTFEFGKDGPRTLNLKLCNSGRGVIHFNNPSGGRVIDWLSDRFSISQTTLDSLRDTTLSPGACFSVDVTFEPSAVGSYSIRARIFDDTECGADTSIWSAVVIPPLAAPDSPREGYAITTIRPSPTRDRSDIAFRLGNPGNLLLEVYDARGRLVAAIHHNRLEGGDASVTFDASNLPAGTYLLRLSSGEWSATTTAMVAR